MTCRAIRKATKKKHNKAAAGLDDPTAGLFSSGFLGELMAAAGAGDGFFAAAPLHAQEHPALWAFEVFIILAVPAAAEKLPRFCLPAGGEADVFPVFLQARLSVAGKHAEKRNEIKEKCEAAGVEIQDYTGYLTNLGGRVPVSSLLELADGKVTLIIDGKVTEYESGEEAIRSIKDRYDIKRVEGMRIELVKPSSNAYVGYEAWAEQHKEQTGEDVSFF